VPVDESRTHDVAFRVDLLTASITDAAEHGDTPVPDADVGRYDARRSRRPRSPTDENRKHVQI